MADTTYFDPTTLARPVKDLQRIELRNKLRDLEVQLNTDRTAADAVETRLGQLSDAGNVLSTQDQAVTKNTSFDLFTFPLAALQGAVWEVKCSAYVTDGTEIQAISLLFHVCAVNKAGTVTAVVTEGIADVVADSASGTLTLVGAAAEDTANVIYVSITLNSSLTPTVEQISWEARCLNSSDSLANVGTKKNTDAA